MSGGSIQLRQYLRARRAGMPTEIAANEAGIGLMEARLHDQGEAKGEYTSIQTDEMATSAFEPSTAPAEGMIEQRESVNGGRGAAKAIPPMLGSGATIGHNSGETGMAEVQGDQLRLYVERIERLEEEKKGMSDDIRDVFNEAKSQGYDVKTMRAIVRLRKMDKHARDEAQALLETYGAQLGLF